MNTHWVLNRRLSLLLWNVAMPRLYPATRNNIIDRLQAGKSQSEVVRQFNIHQNTIWRLWQRLQTGSAQDHPRSCKPRITTPAQDRYIRVFHLHHRKVTDATTAAGIKGLRITDFANAKFDQEDLMLYQFWPGYTDVHLFFGVIHWGSELHWGTGAEFGSTMSHVFFSSDVMDEPIYKASKRAFRPCPCTGSWMMLAAMSHNCRTNLMRVQEYLTSQR